MRNAESKGAGNEATEGAAEAVRAGARIASKATSEVRSRVTSWRQTVVREAQERPGRTAAIALGAGYLLGGGLFSSLTARIVGTAVRVGLRLALIPLVTQTVASLSDGVFGGGDEAGGQEESGGDASHGRAETRNGRRHSAEPKETNP